MQKHYYPLAVLFLCVLLSACSSSKPEETYVERPVDEIYASADAKLKAESYIAAAAEFEEVERQHPYSSKAKNAQLMAGYAYYQALKYGPAIDAFNKFIELHPASEEAAYAYYMKALCYYEQISDVARDQDMTQQSMTVLQDVVRRFPDTSYARDAKLKIDLTQDHLAGKEMEIGRFYQKRGIFVAAINRYRNVVDKFQTTSQVPEALFRLTESNLALGLQDEARRNAAVLGYNYPGSDWYSRSYALLVKDGAAPADQEKTWYRGIKDAIF